MVKIRTRSGVPIMARSGLPRLAYDSAAPNFVDFGSATRIVRRIDGSDAMYVKLQTVPVGVVAVMLRTANPDGLTWGSYPAIVPIAGTEVFAGPSQGEEGAWTAWLLPVDSSGRVGKPMPGGLVTQTIDMTPVEDDVSLKAAGVLSPNPQTEGGAVGYTPCAYNGNPTSITFSYQGSTDGTTGWTEFASRDQSSPLTAWPGSLPAYVSIVEKATGKGVTGTLDTRSAAITMNDAVVTGVTLVSAPVLSPNPQAKGGLIQVTPGTYAGNPTSYAYEYQDSANGTSGWTAITPDTSLGAARWPATARAFVRTIEKVTGQGISTTLDTTSAAIALLGVPTYDFLTSVIRWANTGTDTTQYWTPVVKLTNKPAGTYGIDWFVDWSTDGQVPPRDGKYETDAGRADTTLVFREVSADHWQIFMSTDAANGNPATQSGRQDYAVFGGTATAITEARKANLALRYRSVNEAGPWSVKATMPDVLAAPAWEFADTIIRFDNAGTTADYVTPVITGASFAGSPSGTYGTDWWVAWTDGTYSGRLSKQGDGTYQPVMLTGNGNPSGQTPRTDFSVWQATGVPLRLTTAERTRGNGFALRYETPTQEGFWSAAGAIPEAPDTALAAPTFAFGTTITRFDNAGADFITPVITSASFTNAPSGTYGTSWWLEWTTQSDAQPTAGIETGTLAVRKQGDNTFQIFMGTAGNNGNPATQATRLDFSVFGYDGTSFIGGGGDATRRNNFKLRYATPSATGPFSAAAPIPLPAAPTTDSLWLPVINRTEEQFDDNEFGGPGLQFLRDWGNSINDPELIVAAMDDNIPWASPNFGGDFYTPLAIGLWAGAMGACVWVDPDNAAHWLVMYDSESTLPDNSDATCYMGLFESFDKGRTYRLAQNFLNAGTQTRRDNLRMIVHDPSTSGSTRHIYAMQVDADGSGTNVIQLWRSTNNGSTWAKRGDPLTIATYADGKNSILWLSFTPDGSALYMGTHLGGFRSDKGSGNNIGLNNWTSLQGSGKLPTGKIVFCIRAVTNTVAWAAVSADGNSATAGDGLYKTTDKGATWTQKKASFRALNVNFSPVNTNVMWAHAKGEGPFNSIDGGESWSEVLSLPMNGQDGGVNGSESKIVSGMCGFMVAHPTDVTQVFVPRYQHLGSSESANIVGPRYEKQSGTGNGTVTGIASKTGSGNSTVFAMPGRYILTATNSTTFTVQRPDGSMAPNATVGTTYSNNGLTFRINAGGTAWTAGAVIHLWTNMMVHFAGNGYDGCHTRGMGFHPTDWTKIFLSQQDKVGDYTDSGLDYFHGDCHRGDNDVGAAVKAATNPSGLSWQGGANFVFTAGGKTRVVFSVGDGINHSRKCVVVCDNPELGASNSDARLAAGTIKVIDYNPGNSQVFAAIDPNDNTTGYVGTAKVKNLQAANASGVTAESNTKVFCGLANVSSTTYLYGADASSGGTLYRKTAAAGSWTSWYTLKNRPDRTTSSSNAVARTFRSQGENTHVVVGVDPSHASRAYLASGVGAANQARDCIVVAVEGTSPSAGSEKKVFDPMDPAKPEYMSRELSGAMGGPNGTSLIHPNIRIASVVVDPNDSNVVYIAMMGWGLEKMIFRTRNALGSWDIASGTGNGTVTDLASTESVDYGYYTATCATAATNGGTFTVRKPDGTTLGTAAVGTTFSAGGLTFKITDGSTDWAVGAVIRIHPLPIWQDISGNIPRAHCFMFCSPHTSDLFITTSHGAFIHPAVTRRTNSLYDRVAAFATPLLPTFPF